MKVRKFVSWAILVAMQSAVVVVSIPLGVFLSEKFYPLPQWLLTTLYVTLGPRDLLPLTLHFAVSAFLIFGISTAFLKSRTLRDGLGAVVSFYCLGATLALGAWSVFLGALVRIVPEILFGTGLAATAMFLVLIFSVQAVAYGTAALPRRIADFFILLFRMPVRRHALLLLIVFSLSPIVAARVFKERRRRLQHEAIFSRQAGGCDHGSGPQGTDLSRERRRLILPGGPDQVIAAGAGTRPPRQRDMGKSWRCLIRRRSDVADPAADLNPEDDPGRAVLTVLSFPPGTRYPMTTLVPGMESEVNPIITATRIGNSSI